MSVLKKIIVFKDCNSFTISHCDIYPLARQTRVPSPLSCTKIFDVFQLLHMDVWGPYKVPTYNGMRYFLTIVDDFSRWTWVFLMQLESDVVTLLKDFIVIVTNSFGKKIKAFRSDNGTEFFNRNCHDLFRHYRIIHQSSCPHTPQQNGVVERRHRHILETARAIRFQGNFPIRFWGDCIEAAVYVINRISSSVMGN